MTNDNPILNTPYLEPKLHYDTDSEGSLDYNIVCKGIEKTLSKTEINDQAFDPLYGHLLPQQNKKGQRRLASLGGEYESEGSAGRIYSTGLLKPKYSFMYQEWKEERILIWGKTYPELSSKYNETVCTGGTLENGNFVRIYPIPFRYLEQDETFSKYQLDKGKNKKKCGRPQA